MQELWARNCGCIHREVETPDCQENSVRNFTAMLTQDERDHLLHDPRVIDVVLEQGLERLRPRPKAVQNIWPVMSQTVDARHDNWALDHCGQRNGANYPYLQTGRGVDIVIVDSGVDPDHTEFEHMGRSRVNKIEWEAGQFTNKPKQYIDTNGHGTAVASCAAGRMLGVAKECRIYSIKIFDEDAYNPLTALQLVRKWHNAKTDGRPTVVNNSWGYSTEYPTGHPLEGQLHPIQVTPIDAEIESMIDDGMIVVSAAGNEGHYVAAVTDSKYNERYWMDYNGNYVEANGAYYEYTNRYTPGASDTTICVGSNGDLYPSSRFRMSYFSNRGTAVGVFAPGMMLQCAKSLTLNGRNKMSGTSFSSGVVSGIVALYLENNPKADQDAVRRWIDQSGDHDEVTGALDSARNVTIRNIYNGVRIGNKTPISIHHKANGVWKQVRNIHTSGLAYGNRRNQ